MGSKEWQAGDLCRHIMEKLEVAESTFYRHLKRLNKAKKILSDNGLYSANQSTF